MELSQPARRGSALSDASEGSGSGVGVGDSFDGAVGSDGDTDGDADHTGGGDGLGRRLEEEFMQSALGGDVRDDDER